jgi:transposase-like protein
VNQDYSVQETAEAMNVVKSTVEKWVHQLKDENMAFTL